MQYIILDMHGILQQVTNYGRGVGTRGGRGAQYLDLEGEVSIVQTGSRYTGPNKQKG